MRSLTVLTIVTLALFAPSSLLLAEGPSWALVKGRAELRLDAELVDLRYDAELVVLSPDWQSIPLLSGDYVLRAAELGDGQVHLDGRCEGEDGARTCHRLLLRGQGSRKIRLDLRCTLRKEGKGRRLQLELPAVPALTLRLQSRGQAFRARIRGEEQILESRHGDDGDEFVETSLVPGGRLDLLWWPAGEGTAPLRRDGNARLDGRIDLAPSGSLILARLEEGSEDLTEERTLLLPKRATIRALRDGGGKALAWRSDAGTEGLSVTPLRSRSHLREGWELEYELSASEDEGMRRLIFPRVLGASGQEGLLAFHFPETLEGFPLRAKGLREAGVDEIPAAWGGETLRFVQSYEDFPPKKGWLVETAAVEGRGLGRSLRGVELRSLLLPDGRSLNTARYTVANGLAEPFEFDVHGVISVVKAEVAGREVVVGERRNGDSGVCHLRLPLHVASRPFDLEISWLCEQGPDSWLREAAVELPMLKGVGDVIVPVIWHLDLGEEHRLVNRQDPRFECVARPADWDEIMGEPAFPRGQLVLRPLFAPPPAELRRRTFFGEVASSPKTLGELARLDFTVVDVQARRWTALPFFLLGLAAGAFLLLAHRKEGQWIGLTVPVLALLGLITVGWWGDDWMNLLDFAFAGAFAAGLVGLAYLAMKRDAHLGET